jgi:hypothetical protein
MENKHSPTPWYTGDTYIAPRAIYGADKRIITEVDDFDGENVEIGNANAALIVEAVNTHAAHKEAVRELVELAVMLDADWTEVFAKAENQPYEKWICPKTKKIWDTAKALIAKHSKPEGE